MQSVGEVAREISTKSVSPNILKHFDLLRVVLTGLTN